MITENYATPQDAGNATDSISAPIGITPDGRFLITRSGNIFVLAGG